MFASRRKFRAPLRPRQSAPERLERRDLLSAEPWEIAARIGQRLSDLTDTSLAAEERSRLVENLRTDGDRVTVQAKASGSVEKLQADLRAVGFEESLTYGNLVVGDLPIASISSLAALNSLAFVRPTMRADNDSGTVLSQADISMRSDEARVNTLAAASQPWIDRFALQSQHAEHALVYAA